MNISLTAELKKFVEEKVESGMYYSASEVIRDGLRLLKEQDTLKQIKQEALKREVLKGIEQIKQGECSEYNDEGLKELGETIKQRARLNPR